MGKEDKKDKKDKKDKDEKKDKKDKDEKKDKKKKDKKEGKKKEHKDKKEKDEGKARAISLVAVPSKVNTNVQQKVQTARGAAGIAAEWGPIGQTPGLEIWRVEQFKLVPWPKNLYGQFYDGDSYIVLHTYASGNKMQHNIHFWLGVETSQDEAGTAAIKTVECDDLLGQEPIQFREVQGYESSQFLNYFPAGVTYLHGGVETGFTHVEIQKHVHRLLQLKGKKNIRVSQVALEASSLNEGDVFVLDAGDKIYVWIGASAAVFEKVKGGEVANGLKQQTGGKSQIISLEGKDRDQAEFFALLEGDADDVLSADEGGSDSESDKEHQQKKLFKLSDQSGQLNFSLLAENKNVKENLLKSDDVFILDSGYEIFVWVGKKASAQEKKLAMQHAQDYLTKNNKDAFPISRVMEGGNNQAFLTAVAAI